MISYIKGELTEIFEDSVVLESGQIGFFIRVPQTVLSNLPPLNANMKLYTHMQVREDDMSLFGFLKRDDLDVFKLLITVNGIGPKAAIGILSILTPNDLRFAVLAGDEKTISKAPGIGKKTAQKMILELKDKFKLEDTWNDPLASESKTESEGISANAKQEAILALTALGYSNAEALKAISNITIAQTDKVEDILKAALKQMTA